MLRPSSASHRTPSELLNEAFREVRERLERCVTASNIPDALRAEFQFFQGDPVELFKVAGVFSKPLVKEEIVNLRSLKRGILQLV